MLALMLLPFVLGGVACRLDSQPADPRGAMLPVTRVAPQEVLVEAGRSTLLEVERESR